MRCVEEARTTPRDLSLLLISLMVSLILAELGVRILGLAPSSDRFLMFSSPSFLLDSNSAVTGDFAVGWVLSPIGM